MEARTSRFQASSANSGIGKKTAGGRVHRSSTTHIPYLGCVCRATIHPEVVQSSKRCYGTRMPLASRQRAKGQPVKTICIYEQARRVGLGVALARVWSLASGMRTRSSLPVPVTGNDSRVADVF